MNRSLSQIKTRAHNLDVKMTSKSKWTAEEENVLIQNYARIGGVGCKKLLVNRELGAIHVKAVEMGLKHPYNPNNWTEEDDNYLKTHYPIEGSKTVKELMKTGKYSENAIRARINTLGLKKITKYNIGKNVVCIETGEVYNSAREAAELLNLSYNSLTNACRSSNDHACSGYHFAYTNDTEKQKRLSRFKGKNPQCQRCKRVLCIETQVIFNSVTEAEEWCQGNVTACCKGRSKTAGGYHWKYVEE